MVFTPPPSPLPPAHPTLILERADGSSEVLLSPTDEKEEEPIGAYATTATTIQSHPHSRSSFARAKRRLMVLVVPAVLLLVCSTSSLITHPYARSILDLTSANFNDLLMADPSSLSSSPHHHNLRPTPAPSPTAIWSPYAGNFRDSLPRPPPSNPLGAAVAPGSDSRDFRDAFSKHVHGMRHYGPLGHVRSSFPSRPLVPLVEERNVFENVDEPTFPKALAAVGQEDDEVLTTAAGTATSTHSTTTTQAPNNNAQTSAPAIPTPAWPIPTPCEFVLSSQRFLFLIPGCSTFVFRSRLTAARDTSADEFESCFVNRRTICHPFPPVKPFNSTLPTLFPPLPPAICLTIPPHLSVIPIQHSPATIRLLHLVQLHHQHLSLLLHHPTCKRNLPRMSSLRPLICHLYRFLRHRVELDRIDGCARWYV